MLYTVQVKQCCVFAGTTNLNDADKKETEGITAGADPEIEEGGGHTYRLGIGAACVGHSCLCALAAFVARSTSLKSLRTRLRTCI